MVQAVMSRHTVSPWLVLGLGPNLRDKLDVAYRRLTSTFNQEKFMLTPQAWVQAQQVLIAIEDAYKRIMTGEKYTEPTLRAPEGLSPKLGQLFVLANLLKIGQLEEALQVQTKEHTHIGQVLKRDFHVTERQLNRYLLIQRQMQLPPDSPYLFGQRLLGLGLVTEDMVRVALIEQRRTRMPIGEILVNRRWLSREVLEALL